MNAASCAADLDWLMEGAGGPDLLAAGSTGPGNVGVNPCQSVQPPKFAVQGGGGGGSQRAEY